jgi:hypothetical protein
MEGISYGRKAGRSPDKLKAVKPDAKKREVGAGEAATAPVTTSRGDCAQRDAYFNGLEA